MSNSLWNRARETEPEKNIEYSIREHITSMDVQGAYSGAKKTAVALAFSEWFTKPGKDLAEFDPEFFDIMRDNEGTVTAVHYRPQPPTQTSIVDVIKNYAEKIYKR